MKKPVLCLLGFHDWKILRLKICTEYSSCSYEKDLIEKICKRCSKHINEFDNELLMKGDLNV